MLKRLLLWLWKSLPLSRRMRMNAMWLMNSKFWVGVIGVVIDEQNRILVLNHSYRSISPWALPSGSAHKGEQPQEAIVREIWEEVRLRVEVVALVDVHSHPPFPLLDLTFLLRPVGPVPDPLVPTDAEIAACGFFWLDQLPAKLPDPQPDLVERAVAIAKGLGWPS